MIRTNRRALSIAACSATAYATSWLLDSTTNGTQQQHADYENDSLSSSRYCHCDGIPAAAGIINNINAPVAVGSSPASPILPIRMIRPNPNLEIAFDVRTRTPIYVMEKLNKTTLPARGGGGGRRRRPNFYEEKSIERGDFRSKLSHYHKSGFDRGHMAPGADFPSDSTQDTYTLCNIAPQDPVMNKGIWNSLEEWIRRLVHSDEATAGANSNIYVVTGPLWLPRRQVENGKFEYRHLGLGRPPSLVTVPTHFFKAVVVVNEHDNTQNHIVRFACFVIGNEENCPSKKLEDYVVPWKDLETVTGLQFFPKWATAEWKDKADQVTKLQVPASVGSNASRLFLTDRSAKNLQGSVKSKDKQRAILEHLCANGKCR